MSNNNSSPKGSNSGQVLISAMAIALGGLAVKTVNEIAIPFAKKTANNYLFENVGIPFIILGSANTGKTTLLKRLMSNASFVEEAERLPTLQPSPVKDFKFFIRKSTQVKLKPKYDIPGYENVQTEWARMFKEIKPKGVLFIVDHTDTQKHIDALNSVLNMIETESDQSIRRRVKAFTVLVNKHDLWSGKTSLSEIWDRDYKDVSIRLRAQAANLGYQWAVGECSMLTGWNVSESLQKFFEASMKDSKLTDELFK